MSDQDKWGAKIFKFRLGYEIKIQKNATPSSKVRINDAGGKRDPSDKRDAGGKR